MNNSHLSIEMALYKLNQLIQSVPQAELSVEKWHELHYLQSLHTTEIRKRLIRLKIRYLRIFKEVILLLCQSCSH